MELRNHGLLGTATLIFNKNREAIRMILPSEVDKDVDWLKKRHGKDFTRLSSKFRGDIRKALTRTAARCATVVDDAAATRCTHDTSGIKEMLLREL